jgi:predicted O-methyltransferase YrrM
VDHFYQSIHGCFTFVEFYAFIARHAGEAWHGVEVGALEGQSAAYLAVELTRGIGIRLDLVEREHSNCLAIERNLASVRDVVGAVYAASSVAASQHYSAESLDFVMLDAGHELEDVRSDIRAWWPKIKDGGILAGHDFSIYFHGVVRAVLEAFPHVNVWRCSEWPDDTVSGQRRVDAEHDIRARSAHGGISDYHPVWWVRK